MCVTGKNYIFLVIVMFIFSHRSYEEYQVETVYESVAELQFTRMASALMKNKKGNK